MNPVPPPVPDNGHFADVHGIQMYYELYGEGAPLLLLHGFNRSGRIWASFLDELARHYRLIVPDLRGHGRSTNPSNQFTHRQSALDVLALLEQLGIDRCKAMGISSGGMTLLHMTTQQRRRVEAMVLIGATSYFGEESRAIQRKSSPVGEGRDWAMLRSHHVYGDDQIRALSAQFHNFKDSYDDMNFTAPYLSTIQAKTLIVHGDRDANFPVEIPLEMYGAIPNAYLWIVPNGKHVPILNGWGPTFTHSALEFLSGVWDTPE